MAPQVLEEPQVSEVQPAHMVPLVRLVLQVQLDPLVQQVQLVYGVPLVRLV